MPNQQLEGVTLKSSCGFLLAVEWIGLALVRHPSYFTKHFFGRKLPKCCKRVCVLSFIEKVRRAKAVLFQKYRILAGLEKSCASRIHQT